MGPNNDDRMGHEPATASCLVTVKGRATHGALSHHFDYGPDIYLDLLSWVLDDERFLHWESGDKNFELRCSGAPGSGKTTLAAFVAKELRSKYGGEKDAVASVFIQHDIGWQEASFVEDFLVCILHQLSARHACADANNHHATCALCREAQRYATACHDGQRTASRIKLVRQALETCISALEHAFLVLDGFDRCNAAVELFLEDEFCRLRARGLKIMTTSRIPCLREPLQGSWYRCDGGECEDPENRQICWVCRRCETDDDFFVLCPSCKEAGEMCENCDDDSDFAQPYDHVDLDISLANNDTMYDFVSRNLESEHGDLGVGSGDEPKPPPSRLGLDIRRAASGREADALVDRTVGLAADNIALALARLELVHGADTVEDTRRISDRLPGSIVALFDAGLRAVAAQPPERRDLGLKAIAAVAHASTHGRRGLRYADLDRWLREAERLAEPAEALGLRRIPHRSLEDILHASRGFLVATVPAGQDERFVEGYHDDFVAYACGGYCEALVWAASQLQFDKLQELQKLSRSSTIQVDKLGSAAAERERRLAGGGREEKKKNKTKKKDVDVVVTIRRIGTGRYNLGGGPRTKITRRETGWG